MMSQVPLHAEALATALTLVFLLLQMHQLEMCARISLRLTDLVTVQTQPLVVGEPTECVVAVHDRHLQS